MLDFDRLTLLMPLLHVTGDFEGTSRARASSSKTTASNPANREMQTRLPSQALRLLWAFDFDGVVCHSAKELCITGGCVCG